MESRFPWLRHSDAGIDGGSSSPNAHRKCLLAPVPLDAAGCLEELERRLAVEIEKWTEAATMTEGECGELLVFFGLERPSPARMGSGLTV